MPMPHILAWRPTIEWKIIYYKVWQKIFPIEYNQSVGWPKRKKAKVSDKTLKKLRMTKEIDACLMNLEFGCWLGFQGNEK